jgi:hypothetical protein
MSKQPHGALDGEPGSAEGSNQTEEEPRPPAEECRSGLTRAAAEDLLDWLEAHGCRGRVLLDEGDKGFAVRWREGPEARRRRAPCPGGSGARPPATAREPATLSWAPVGLGLWSGLSWAWGCCAGVCGAAGTAAASPGGGVG